MMPEHSLRTSSSTLLTAGTSRRQLPQHLCTGESISTLEVVLETAWEIASLRTFSEGHDITMLTSRGRRNFYQTPLMHDRALIECALRPRGLELRTLLSDSSYCSPFVQIERSTTAGNRPPPQAPTTKNEALVYKTLNELLSASPA